MSAKWERHGDVMTLVDQFSFARAYISFCEGYYYAVYQIGPGQWREVGSSSKFRLMSEVKRACPYTNRGKP